MRNARPIEFVMVILIGFVMVFAVSALARFHLDACAIVDVDERRDGSGIMYRVSPMVDAPEESLGCWLLDAEFRVRKADGSGPTYTVKIPTRLFEVGPEGSCRGAAPELSALEDARRFTRHARGEGALHADH